jgi:long-chain acyl-CoA synthetase
MPESFASESLPALHARISDVVKPWAERSPDHAALVEATGTWTYRQLGLVVSRTQAWLGSLGIRPGDRVMIVGENCREFVALLLGTAFCPRS